MFICLTNFKVQFLEDNQAAITTLRPSLNVIAKSFGTLIVLRNCRSLGCSNSLRRVIQVADIFAKPFSERGKWEHALKLINHIPKVSEQPAEKPGRVTQAETKKSQAVAAIQEVKMIASELLRLKSFDCAGLERLCEEMSKSKAAKKSHSTPH